MNMLLIILAVCTDVGREMPCISRNFHNFCGCRDKPEDDEWLNCSILELAQSQSSKSHVSLQYVMLCTIPLSTTSSSASTDDVSGVSTNDVSSLCVSLQNAILCTIPLSTTSSSASTDDVSGASTNDVSGVSTGDVSDVSIGDVSGVSNDNVSSLCVSLQNAILCTNPPSCSSFCALHKAAILRTCRILAKPCRMGWKLLSRKF